MKKRILTGSALSLAILLATTPASVLAQDNTAQYDLYATVYDYGPRVDKIVLELPEEVKADSVETDSFHIQSANKSQIDLEVTNGDRVVTNAYVTDNENGEETDSGKYITIELETNLNTQFAEVLQWDEESFSNYPMDMNYNVEQIIPFESVDGEEISYTYTMDEFIQNEVDLFTSGESEEGIHYRDYKPEDDGEKHPLIIWLHGAGEGGDSNVTQINGNRGATAFISKEAQEAFDNPYVLAPQSPDYWMPELVLGETVLKGTDNTDKVVALIKEYIAANENIDTSRVYIGGCSMGGYQTWETLFAAPELFATAFPICAAYEVPQDRLDTVKDTPIWIIHAENDDTIPVQYSRDAYNYLKDNGGNVHYTEYPNVQIDGQDFSTHASWIYPLNNDPKLEDGTTFFEWMSSQKKETSSTNEQSNLPIIIGGVIILVAIAGFIIYKKK